jgi:hypothetical protein
MYQKIVDTGREKVINSIAIEELDGYGSVLKVNINGSSIYFDAKDK